MEQTSMVDVFISYARQDHERVEYLNRALRELGLDVFFDIDGIDGGDEFPEVIDRAVKGAGVVVGCWTPHALSRDWVKTECLIALERKVLVPLEFETVTSLDVPAAFFSLNRISLIDWRGERAHAGIKALMRAVGKKLRDAGLQDRAGAAAAIKGLFPENPSLSPAAMNLLWVDWLRLGAGSDQSGLEKLREAALGTLIETLVNARLEDLRRPPAARLLGGSTAVGMPPRRGWARARYLALFVVPILLVLGALATTWKYNEHLKARSESIVQSTNAEKGQLARQLEMLRKQGAGFVRTNPFLRGLNRDQFLEFFGDHIDYADGFLGRRDIFARYRLDTPQRIAYFLAQAAHESDNFKYTEELGAPAVLSKKYANRLGNGDEASGDGWRYRGRGFFQFTGKENYRAIGELLWVDLIAEPDLMATDPEVAFAAAALWWDTRNLNAFADADDLRTMTRRISGGYNGFKNRQKQLSRARAALGITETDK